MEASSPLGSENLSKLVDLEHACLAAQSSGNYEKALQLAEQSFAMRQSLFGAFSEESQQARLNLAAAFNSFAVSLLHSSSLDQCQSYLQKASVICDDLEKFASVGDDRSVKVRSVTLNNLACLYRRRGKLGSALAAATDALRLEESFALSEDIASTLLNVCSILSQMDRHKEALSYAERSLRVLQDEVVSDMLFSNDQSSTSSVIKDKISIFAIAHHNIGVELEFLKMHPQATHSYEKAHAIALKHLGQGHNITQSLGKSLRDARRAAAKQTLDRVSQSSAHPSHSNSSSLLSSSLAHGEGPRPKSAQFSLNSESIHSLSIPHVAQPQISHRSQAPNSSRQSASSNSNSMSNAPNYRSSSTSYSRPSSASHSRPSSASTARPSSGHRSRPASAKSGSSSRSSSVSNTPVSRTGSLAHKSISDVPLNSSFVRPSSAKRREAIESASSLSLSSIVQNPQSVQKQSQTARSGSASLQTARFDPVDVFYSQIQSSSSSARSNRQSSSFTPREFRQFQLKLAHEVYGGDVVQSGAPRPSSSLSGSASSRGNAKPQTQHTRPKSASSARSRPLPSSDNHNKSVPIRDHEDEVPSGSDRRNYPQARIDFDRAIAVLEAASIQKKIVSAKHGSFAPAGSIAPPSHSTPLSARSKLANKIPSNFVPSVRNTNNLAVQSPPSHSAPDVSFSVSPYSPANDEVNRDRSPEEYSPSRLVFNGK